MAPSLTVDETNFLRLVALIIGLAPKAVRCYFDRVFPPNNLQSSLLNHQTALDDLRYRKRVLTLVQYNVLFPSGSAVTSKNFDITLMICLLRNIGGITPPVKGYDTFPSSVDISTGADLARIKYYRNRIAHSTDSKVVTNEFEDAWNEASTAIGRLGGTVFQQECLVLKSSNLDSESYKDILLNICHSKDAVADTLASMVEALKIKTSDIENLLKDTVPQHIRAFWNNAITNWIKDDCEFVTTNQLKTIFVPLETKGSLTITGNSGVGKSFTTRHIALHLHHNGYEIMPVRNPVDIFNYVSTNAKLVFVFDDVCGKTHLLHNEIEDWERYSDEIANCISGKDIKILCNCRLQIFQSKPFESLYLLRECQFNLFSSDFTIPEKRLIASKYVSETVLEELSDECIQVHDCFPLLCRMAKTWETSKALTFLLNPIGVFENELKQMRSRDKLNFCGLLFVTIFNNSLNDELLIDDIGITDRNTLNNILEECGETRGTSRKLIKDHLDSMIGVYLIFEDNSYRFANERLFEMTFTFMAKTFLKCIIKHCTVSMLCDKFGLECLDEGRRHYQFFVPSYFEIFFFERLLKETTDDNFLDIFDCKQMNDRNYRSKFLAFLKNFDSKEIKRLLNLSYFGIGLFHHVCKRGYTYFALFCLEKGVDINKYDDIGMTPLHTACKYENEKLVNVLLNAGATVNLYESRGFSALFGACMSGNVDVVNRLLENHANPNLCSDRCLIPLLLVSEKGYSEIAKLLTKFGAKINKQDDKGFTALHQACRSGHEKIVEMLLENGANVNKYSSDGETPLHITCSTSFNNIINVLVANRADLLAVSGKTGLSPLKLLQRDKKEVLISLIKTVISKDEIYIMIEYSCEENDKDLLEILMESDIDINRFMTSGQTALHIASFNGNLEIANLLLENQAIVNMCSTKGETVLQRCCLSLNCELVKYLITKGADINDPKASVILPLPLHLACLLNNYEMCSIFLQNDDYIDVNKKQN
ncbi:ANK [Mytilus coruscus]|uniref:ANK n=1 Tax=Mytilus coruscus TaxID=42192 RepID=A0A6J7ZVE6_MYTCO|nr:ANK [Mytilus coruscus]